MARLSLYNKKRDFTQTREPRGRLGKGKGYRFVVQRHDATRLHYDLRLELDGVYKSWAVTKVPSLDPAVKRLAVEVEDHPLDYGTFEGTIPEGQYGGGTVQLWDNGTWQPQSDTEPGRDLARGSLKFELDGKRLHGGWALVRMKDRDREGRPTKRHNWLLIKEKDELALPGEPDALQAVDTSVKTGRTLDEIAANRKAPVWNSNRADADGKPPKPRSASSKKKSRVKRPARTSRTRRAAK
jgi:bifunctional non-homologous end joining protein LigD